MDNNNFLDAVYAERDAAFWHRRAMRALLALGAGHLLVGIVFFFAYNWADLAAFAKFGLIQVGIVACVALSIRLAIESAAGQALLIGASVLTGVLFAVIGQVYQTGADAYELFVAWSVLILPWVIASRSSAHWFLWMAICFAALSFYSAQVLRPLALINSDQITVLLSALTLGFLVLRETTVFFRVDWMAQRWLRLVLVAGALGPLFAQSIGYIFTSVRSPIGVALFIGTVVAAAWVYTKFLIDFAAIAIATGFVALLLMALGGRVIFEAMSSDFGSTFGIIFGLFLLVLWCAALTAGTLRFLKTVQARIRHGGHDV